MRSWDVAIVGGGPAGTSTALHLVREGKVDPSRILLLDKAKHPREKPCAGAVSAWGLEALTALGIPVEVPHVVMGGLRAMDGPSASVYSGEALGIVVRRDEFDASLLQRVRQEGVDVRDGEGLVHLVEEPHGVRLTTTQGTYTARRVAACDGVGSTVRKVLGLKEPARKGHLWVVETPLEGHERAGASRGLLDFDLSVASQGVEGYTWDFPTWMGGQLWMSRGIYHANGRPFAPLRKVLLDELEKRGVSIRGLRFKPFSTRPFVRQTQLRTESGAILFVGEAAGIDATTGEGIAQALLMGAMAARSLAAKDAKASGKVYERTVFESRLGRHLLQSAWFAPRVYGPQGARWRRFLADSPSAVEAGARWYAGSPLSLGAKASLLLRLVPRVVFEPVPQATTRSASSVVVALRTFCTQSSLP